MKNFVEQGIDAGGFIQPLVIPAEHTNGTSLFNPSIFVDGDNVVLNLRHCQYTFYHSEKKVFEHEYGPLIYLNPENDITLTTTNYFCKLHPNTLHIEKFYKVDTSKFDAPPLWQFVGLEDARVVRWDNKLYLCGVRRDTTTHGEGRMELCEIIEEGDSIKEISRWRIPAPGANDTYCEKNWMPVLDLPYHFVKWSNPTEVVKIDPVKKTCETVFHGKYEPKPYDYRGGSQVISVGDYYVTLTHITALWRNEVNRKDSTYRNAFVVWDKNWNVVKYTPPFSFMGADIEFSCGMAKYKGTILITFGFQDNAAFVLCIPEDFLVKYINEAPYV